MDKNSISKRIIEKFYGEYDDKIELSIQDMKRIMDNLFFLFLESSSLEELSDESVAEIWSEIWLDICEKSLDYEEVDEDEQ